MSGNQHVIRRCAWKDRCDLRAQAHFTRQVFRTMHCNIDIFGKERSLNFCREQSFSPVAQVRHSGFVLRRICTLLAFIIRSLKSRATFLPFRHYDFGLDLQVRPRCLNSFFNQMGLRARQLAAARAKDDFLSHRTNVAPVGEAGSFPYSSEARSEPSATEGCSAARATLFTPRAIKSTKSATCSAMISSAAAICWRRSLSDWSATDCKESMSSR